MRIFARVPGRGSNDIGLSTVFSAFAGYIFGTFRDMRPTLLHSDMKSLVWFPLIPKYVTTNYPEWLFYVKFCFRASSNFFAWLSKTTGRKRIQIGLDPYCQRQTCSYRTLVSGLYHMDILPSESVFLCSGNYIHFVFLGVIGQIGKCSNREVQDTVQMDTWIGDGDTNRHKHTF